MAGAGLDDADRALLEEPNFATVSVLRPDGDVYAVVVWVDIDGERVVLNTAEGRRWLELARRDPRMTVTVYDRENPYEYVSVRGRLAEDTHEGADAHIDAMARKYMGVDEYPYRSPGEQRVLLRVTPEHVRHQTAG
jgi:PPOX class probable F420-dependent enzyme